MGASSLCGWIDDHGFEVAGQHDLQNFDIVRVRYFAVANARRLVHAGASFQSVLTLALVLKNRPALEHINQLHGHLVHVPFARGLGAFARTNDVHDRLALSGQVDAQVAVFKIFAKAVVFERTVFGVLDAEGHGCSSRAEFKVLARMPPRS
jgi:hypothetical protein